MKRMTNQKKTKSRKTTILPINGSDSTPASLAIDAHYARLGIRKRWNKERITSLCSFLRITESELGSILGVSHGWFREHINNTRPLSGPICILLTIMEARFMGGYTNDIITNLFDYGQQEDT